MGKLLNIGLVTLLAGAVMFSSGCSSKNQLREEVGEGIREEMSIERQLQDSSKNEYVSSEGYYSLGHNPSDYGGVLEMHASLQQGVYMDGYTFSIANLVIAAVPNKPELALREEFDSTVASIYRGMQQLIGDNSQPEDHIYMIQPEGPPKEITVDNHPGIGGSMEIINQLHSNKGDSIDYRSITIKSAVVRGKDFFHIFTFFNRFYNEGDKKACMDADRFYEDALKTFHALKSE